MRLSKAAAEYYRSLADRYAREKDVKEYELGEVIAWANEKDLLDLTPREITEVHCTLLSEALRSDMGKDSQGRRVRLRHCVESVRNGNGRTPQLRAVWAHVDHAKAGFLRRSLEQRRQRIVRDVEQLKADLEYINGRLARRNANQITMTFDFTASDNDGMAASA